MSGEQLRTPVALLVFNRPQVTQQVFAAITQVRPRQLLVVADGPRPLWPSDVANCAEVREIVQAVDWPCEVLTNYSAVNLGCRQRVSSGLDWVFEVVEEAIILEDDCLPHPTFFRYCEELLLRYRDDERIAHIGGGNFQPGQFAPAHSYYFSRYPHVWGWASWRRAWRHFDVKLGAWADSSQHSRFLQQFESRREQAFWRNVWNAVSAGQIDTWDFQWAFACLQGGGLAIVPAGNLVTNIGFGVDSTHTDYASPVAQLPQVPMAFPLNHPPTVARHALADDRVRRLFFMAPSLLQRVRAGLGRRLKRRPA